MNLSTVSDLAHGAVTAVYLLLGWPVSYWVKLPLVVAATFLVSWAAYEAIRRSRWLRPLFGLRREGGPRAAVTEPVR